MSEHGVLVGQAEAEVNGVNSHINGVNGVNGVNGHQNDQDVSYEAIIIGAGFAGLRELYELRKRGVSARVFDAASGVGGVSRVFAFSKDPLPSL